MTQRDTQAGRPSWSLAPQALSIAYGQAQFMSSTGAASPSGWFGPLTPLTPIAPPEVAGRQMDFPSGYNIVSGARAYEPIGFEDLRALAETYDLLRLVIETRKDQVERMSWNLRPRRGATGPGGARINQLTRFFERPDGQHCFAIWLRMLLEDLFVIDAPTLWRQRARGGELVALHPLDGATIKRVIDDWGRTPQPFVDNGALVHPVAYQQILKGYPAVDYAARDIIYAPRNPRASRVYGFSPVEQIVMTANIALKRQMFTLSHFTEGNIPESLIGVPDSWTPDQIKNFQDYWDAYFTGDLAARRRAKFVPGGVAKTFIQTKEPELKGVFDEWLARIVCYAFSVSHQAFVNQTNRSTGETQKEMAEEEGLWPVLKWVKRPIDGVLIGDFGEEDIEFAWGEDAQIDAGQQAQVLTSYVGAGILTRNEARVKLGEAPVADPAANVLTVTGPAPTPVGQGSAELAKGYNPEQPRDWHGRFGSGSGGEAKAPRVRATSARDSRNVAGSDASGPFVEGSAAAIAPDLAANIAAAIPGGLAAAGAALETAGPAAQALLANPVTATAAAALGLGALAYYAYNHWNEQQNSSSAENEPASSNAEDSKPADTTPQTSVAAAGTPAPDPGDQHNEQNPEEKFKVPDREPSIEIPEDKALGTDLESGQFRPNEVKTAWRLQEELQQPLARDATKAGDWVGPDGKIYDAVGPAPSEYFSAKSFNKSIDSHLLKSGTISVIDVTGLNAEQIAQVDAYVSSLPPESLAKIITIGF